MATCNLVRVEAGNVQKRAQNLFDRLERDIDVARQIRPLLAAQQHERAGAELRAAERRLELLEGLEAQGITDDDMAAEAWELRQRLGRLGANA